MEKPLTCHTDPILTLTYTPAPPDLTIRTIVRVIEGAGGRQTPFTASIHHPPSLEDRARYMQRREQRHILWRLLFSVIIAIPMFLLGVVYMTLVSSTNPTRIWLEEPIWAGNASRGVWAMFFMATPVMLYSAGMFHRRSLREIYALWRRGSRTPVWKRFVRFGSMNLLVRLSHLAVCQRANCRTCVGLHRCIRRLLRIDRTTGSCCSTNAVVYWTRRYHHVL